MSCMLSSALWASFAAATIDMSWGDCNQNFGRVYNGEDEEVDLSLEELKALQVRGYKKQEMQHHC